MTVHANSGRTDFRFCVLEPCKDQLWGNGKQSGNQNIMITKTLESNHCQLFHINKIPNTEDHELDHDKVLKHYT